jgi:hypothetical protein
MILMANAVVISGAGDAAPMAWRRLIAYLLQACAAEGAPPPRPPPPPPPPQSTPAPAHPPADEPGPARKQLPGGTLVLQQRPGIPVVAMPGMPVLAGRPRTPADGRFSAETAIFVSDMPRFAVRRHHRG